MPTTKEIIDIITQVGFPIALTIGVFYYIGKSGLPKILATFDQLSKDFREELIAERDHHNAQMDRLYQNQDKMCTEIRSCVKESETNIVRAIDQADRAARTHL